MSPPTILFTQRDPEMPDHDGQDARALTTPDAAVGVVAIGRNEGERMVTCLRAALAQAPNAVVYVDSGSTDGSLQRAREMGAIVVDLDLSTPFTAARARNAGLTELLRRRPEVEFVQFLDADCEMSPGWLAAAVAKLRGDDLLAGVAGRLRERFPEATIYNRLCDMEWQAPAGETRAVGGNAMLRVRALGQVGGYDPSLIAGEEPEMCVRLRERGWRLWRLEADMALHDAAMTRFSQWWRRAVRFGYAQAQVSQKHRHSTQRIWHRETRSTIAWGLGPPLLAAASVTILAIAFGGWWWLLGLLPLELYDLLALKVYLRARREDKTREDAALYAAAITLAKFPQFQGVLRFLLARLTGRGAGIMEYKRPEQPPVGEDRAG